MYPYKRISLKSPEGISEEVPNRISLKMSNVTCNGISEGFFFFIFEGNSIRTLRVFLRETLR